MKILENEQWQKKLKLFFDNQNHTTKITTEIPGPGTGCACCVLFGPFALIQIFFFWLNYLGFDSDCIYTNGQPECEICCQCFSDKQSKHSELRSIY